MAGTSTRRVVLYTTLFLLYVLHNDLWLWHDAEIVMGFPVGLTYHLGYCFVTAATLWVLVRKAWPSHLGKQGGEKRL